MKTATDHKKSPCRLTLTADQSVDLSNTIAHLPEPDRQAFLVSRNLFADSAEVGDGELALAVRSLWASVSET
jgi:hypothetical protein